jgi:pyrimidine-nucleoside phosphorylase
MTVIDHRRVVSAKRDGRTLTPLEVEGFVSAYTAGEVSDALAAAFLMACLLRGLDDEETLALTRAMVESGTTVSFPRITGPTVDKHSTGGVADGVTLAFAPLVAALGSGVAKLSGRGLGHTGGTLDKLEAIPGLRTDLTAAEMQDQVERIGCAIAAQSPDLVPADGALYALRDATATVPSVSLIAASVMAKKLAVHTDLILLDVTAGSGAFMRTSETAEDLARACRRLALGWGREVAVAVTDMSQPLGDAIGNALDVAEAVAVLRGEHRGSLRELTLRFATRARRDLDGEDQARRRAEEALDGGAALERFARMVEAQGGDPRVVDAPWSVLPRAQVVVPLVPDRTGTLAAMDAEAVGTASGALGAGRVRKGDAIDPAVGIVIHAKIGDRLEAGEPIGEVHARRLDAAEAAAAAVLRAMILHEGPVEPPPLVYRWFDGDRDDEGREG